MSAFDEVRFPTTIAFSSTGGPTRKTQIVIMGSGAEARNALWNNSRRSYNIVYGPKSLNDLDVISQFFEARNGRLIGFRFKDHKDFQSCPPQNTPTAFDQLLGYGNSPATQTQYQLTKTYASGPSSWVRKILKPVAGTVLIAVGGVQLASNQFSVDTTTGIVTLNTPPGTGVAVHGGFQFDVPARFDVDQLVIELKDFKVGYIQNLPVVELFTP